VTAMLYYSNEYIVHYGVKGQRWGDRRFQNEDGSLTEEGRRHYGVGEGGNRAYAKLFKKQNKVLQRLQAKADINTQKKTAEKYSVYRIRSKKIGNKALLGGASAFATAVGYPLFAKPGQKWTQEQIDASSMKGQFKKRAENYAHQKNEEIRIKKTTEKLNTIGAIGAILGTAGFLGSRVASSIFGSKYRSAMKNLSPEGHAKAVAKAKSQFNKMSQTFKNTPYMDLFKDISNNLENNYEPITIGKDKKRRS
jgi:hypothetical protein